MLKILIKYISLALFCFKKSLNRNIQSLICQNSLIEFYKHFGLNKMTLHKCSSEIISLQLILTNFLFKASLVTLTVHLYNQLIKQWNVSQKLPKMTVNIIH